jgi:hypothetical protein
MSSILIEILASLLSFPTGPPPSGRTLDSSLGAVAAFFGFVALLFALPLVVFLGAPLPLALGLSLVVIGCATLGILAARKAPRVTNRNLGLAKAGYVGSIIAIGASVVALVVAASRALM